MTQAEGRVMEKLWGRMKGDCLGVFKGQEEGQRAWSGVEGARTGDAGRSVAGGQGGLVCVMMGTSGFIWTEAKPLAPGGY